MSLNSTAGDAAAESYFAISEADTYFSNRGVAAWTGADAVKEAAARLGTQYLDNRYRGKWNGISSTETQALAWPRSDGYRDIYRSLTYPLQGQEGFALDQTTIPAQVKYAAMEAALLALGGTALEPTLERGGRIKSLAETVGPISETTVWEDGAAARDTYTAIEGYLRGLVSSSNNVKLVRA